MSSDTGSIPFPIASSTRSTPTFHGAGPKNADLSIADLSGADLTGAYVSEDQLRSAESLKGATMPNGQKYEDWLKSKGREEE